MKKVVKAKNLIAFRIWLEKLGYSVKTLADNRGFTFSFKKEYGSLERDESNVLKKAPKDYDPNHPAIEFLKLKSFTATQKISDELFYDKDFAKKITQKLIALKPLNEFLNRALETVE